MSIEFACMVSTIGLIHDEAWPDPASGLILEATRQAGIFFQTMTEELPPSLTFFRRVPEGVLMSVAFPVNGDDSFKEGFAAMIEMMAQQPDFEGAMTMVEDYMTRLTDEPATRENTGRESLVQVLYDRQGFVQIRSTPFHRETEPGRPVQDGATDVTSREDGESIKGRCVAEIRKA